MFKIIFLNGQYLPLKRAGISPYDLGLLRGYGVFDVMKTVNSKPFLINDHWARFKKSAKTLDLRISVSDKKYFQVVNRLLRLNKIRGSAIIRTMITGGVSSDGITPEGKETFYVVINKLKPLPKEKYARGVKVITMEYQRDFPEAKVNNYVMAIKNIKTKKVKGAHEILYINKGKVKEGALSNFFIVKRGRLITPKESILIGVTRNLIIKFARRSGRKIIEKDIELLGLCSADEIFLTNTTKGIVPVVKVNNKKIGLGKPGKITGILMEELADYVKNY